MDKVTTSFARLFQLGVLVVLGFGFCSVSAQSQPIHLGTHTDWDVYELETNQGKVCYVASNPLASKPEMDDRGPTWVLVTHRPATSVRDEVGVIAGYSYQAGAGVSVIIDTQKFELFSQDDGAWLRTSGEEAAMVAAMKKGRRMSVVGYSSSGVTTTDDYSLLGFTASHRQASDACDLR